MLSLRNALDLLSLWLGAGAPLGLGARGSDVTLDVRLAVARGAEAKITEGALEGFGACV